MQRILISGIYICLFISFSFGQSSMKKIEQYLSQVYLKGITPGFSVAIVKKSEVIYSRGFGVEINGEKRSLTPKSILPIGSIAKSFTALAVLQLAEEGKLSLDEPITKYLSWFRTANQSLSDQITLRMLLSNTSGIVGRGGQSSFPDEMSMDALKGFVKSLEAEYIKTTPGLSFEYSNPGFNIAGLIISEVSGMPYWEYLEKKIFSPLNMNHSTTNPLDFKEMNVLAGHHYGINSAIPQAHHKPSAIHLPAGSHLSSNAVDMVNYLKLFLNKGKFNGYNLLDSSSIELLMKPQISFQGSESYMGCSGPLWDYCLGLMHAQFEGKNLVFHGGSTGKTSAMMMLEPEKEIGVVFLSNLDHNFMDTYTYENEFTICFNILKLLNLETITQIGKPCEDDKSINSYELTDSLKDFYVGSYTLSEGGDIFMYYDTEMDIHKSKSGQLIGSIRRDGILISQFELDFINPVLAVNRNIGKPLYIQFKRKISGKIQTCTYHNAVYIKNKAISWDGKWENGKYIFPFAIQPHWYVKSGINKSAILDDPQYRQRLLKTDFAYESNLQTFQKQGIRWQQLSWVINNELESTQSILLWTNYQGKEYWLFFQTERRYFQQMLIEIILPMIDSMKI